MLGSRPDRAKRRPAQPGATTTSHRTILYSVLAALMVVDFSGAWAISSAVVRKNYRNAVPVQPAEVRPWVAQPYFGTVINGVALGKLVTVSTEPPSPDKHVCWFWASDTRTQGYWDYCKPPQAR